MQLNANLLTPYMYSAISLSTPVLIYIFPNWIWLAGLRECVYLNTLYFERKDRVLLSQPFSRKYAKENTIDIIIFICPHFFMPLKYVVVAYDTLNICQSLSIRILWDGTISEARDMPSFCKSELVFGYQPNLFNSSYATQNLSLAFF